MLKELGNKKIKVKKELQNKLPKEVTCVLK